MNTGIFYGTTTGVAGELAIEIGKALGVDTKDIHDVSSVGPAQVNDYDLIIFGASTHGSGDLQTDMEDFLNGVIPLDLKGKKIALFGCGDVNMTDTFCDGVGEMYDALQGTGAQFVGAFPAGCYDFDHSRALRGETAVGLLLDQENHPQLTPERIAQWVLTIK